MSRILVTGGAGFLGASIIPLLVAQGHEVSATVFSRDAEPKVEGVIYRECDLTCRAGWDAALLSFPEVVYNCAGKTGGSGLDPLHFVTDNALIALHMYRGCAEHGVKRIVQMSSTTGYPDSGQPMKEDDYFIGDPHPAYFNPGHTKRFIERLGAMWAHRLESVFIRVAGVYGPGSDFDPQSSHVIEATIRKVAERQDPITVWGDGSAWRDAIHIDDFARAAVKCLAAPAGAYNLAFGFGMSVNEMVATLIQHVNQRHIIYSGGAIIQAQAAKTYAPKIIHDMSKPAMIPVRKLDCNKAWKELDWNAHTSMAEGLRKTLDWYEAAHG